MPIKSKKRKLNLPEIGEQPATLKEVEYKPTEDDPKKVILKFAPDTNEGGVVSREYQPNLNTNAPLRKDIEAILEKGLTTTELDGEYEVEQLVGKRCLITVQHKNGPGGRLTATVVLVRPISKQKMHVAAEVSGPGFTGQAPEPEGKSPTKPHAGTGEDKMAASPQPNNSEAISNPPPVP